MRDDIGTADGNKARRRARRGRLIFGIILLLVMALIATLVVAVRRSLPPCGRACRAKCRSACSCPAAWILEWWRRWRRVASGIPFQPSACGSITGATTNPVSPARLRSPSVRITMNSSWVRVRAPRRCTNGRRIEHERHLERELAGLDLLDGRGGARLTAYQLLDFETYLSGDLLTQVDRCTMAHGVESRAPFLRPALIEFALELPDAAKLHGASGKHALKQAAATLLPAELVARRKQGFSPPLSAWARGSLRGYVNQVLSPQRLRRAGILDVPLTTSLLKDHLSGHKDRGRTLWAVLSLQCWADHWLLGGR